VAFVTRNLAELRAPDVARLVTERSIFVQPLGAVEQHGPHLPFNTDLLIADRVSSAGRRTRRRRPRRVAAAAAGLHEVERARMVVGHGVAVGHHAARRARRHRPMCGPTTAARKLVFFNGHGGNSALVGVANRELRLAHGLMTFLDPPGRAPGPGRRVGAGRARHGVHGGTDETSMMLHLAPTWSTWPPPRNVPEHLAENRYVRFGGRSASAGCRTTSAPTATSATRPRRPRSAASAGSTGAVDAFCEALAEIATVRVPGAGARDGDLASTHGGAASRP
jgi:creatinine amidohydrolase